MYHTQFLQLIETIAARPLTGKEKLTIIEAMAKCTADPVESEPPLRVKTGDGSALVTRESYITAKHRAWNDRGQNYYYSVSEVREALNNVLNGMVHSPLEHSISDDLIF